MTEHSVYLGLGTNLGDKEDNLRRAVEHIDKLIGKVLRQSAYFTSQPWGFVSDNVFVNAAVCCRTVLSPQEVLCRTQQIEQMMGRKHKSVDGIYHDRIIDIDILLYDELQIDEPNLTIPHPLMHEREFVMVPLMEVVDNAHQLLPVY